ncbi:MAG: iron-sulfur cluster carrier protein ApbC [Gammaproteobacteria bacterium]|nr:iron-sulfur cluster carrier protein ApbC [Gammaproteobacteria bacterium]
MVNTLQTQIEALLKTVIDDNLQQDLLSSGTVKKLEINGDTVTLDIVFGYRSTQNEKSLNVKLSQALAAIEGIHNVHVTVTSKIVAHTTQNNIKPFKNIKNIIPVASGKGGVGKSTVSINLALALAAEGASVGILDADIYGPSLPRMIGNTEKPVSNDGKLMEPISAWGIQAMSMGNLVSEETAMIWRGPMVTQALNQLMTETDWHDLDYLIIDMPPGTGDIQLTLAQKFPVSGALVVTTPQDIALLDAHRALKMFEKVNIPVLGVIENMSTHICSNCQHEEAIFGSGGGEKMAQQNHIELLGKLPLDISIRENADRGQPSVAIEPDSKIAQIYRKIALRAAAQLSKRPKDYSSKFPEIVVNN